MRVQTLFCAAIASLLFATPVFAEAELEPAFSAPEETVVESAESEGPVPGELAGAGARVPRATFTTDVLDREPQDSVTEVGNDHPRIFYFAEILGMTGRSVTHRWEYAGEVKAEVTQRVGGPRWRVFSSKNLDPSWLGEWSVTLLDDSGGVLRRDVFAYTEISEEIDPAVPASSAPQP
jgi:hypothetical protein